MQMVQEHGEFMCFHSVKTFWMYFTLKSKFLAKIHDILYRSAKLIYIKLLMCAVIDNSKSKQTGRGGEGRYSSGGGGTNKTGEGHLGGGRDTRCSSLKISQFLWMGETIFFS